MDIEVKETLLEVKENLLNKIKIKGFSKPYNAVLYVHQ